MKTKILISLTALSLVAATSPSRAGLLAHYTFDNAADRGEDISGNGNDGLPGNGTHATTYITDTVAGVSTTVLNSASASTGWAIPNTAVTVSVSAYSIAGWMKSTDTNGYLFGQRDGDDADRLIITPSSPNGVIYNGTAWYGGDAGGGGMTRTDYSNAFMDDAWHHFAFVVDGTSVSIYLDGTLWDSITMNEAGNILNPVTTDFRHRFGSDGNGGTELTGRFDDLRLYDHALTSGEVEALFGTSAEIKITNVEFVGGDLKITFTPGGAGYILTSSDDLLTAFTEETNATYDGTDTFTVEDADLNPGQDFFRVEEDPTP